MAVFKMSNLIRSNLNHQSEGEKVVKRPVRSTIKSVMCNRVVQKGKIIKPGERITVLLKGPGATFELSFDGAVFAGPAKTESRGYWIKREGAEEVVVPDISRFGERNKSTDEQGWEDLPPGSALEGLLLPQPPGKEYRLLKVVTQPATAEQLARLGNDRAPVVRPSSPEFRP
jgi:hypothetical protein